MTIDGLITIASGNLPGVTMDRLAAAVTAHGMTIVARIDYAAAAAKAGLALTPTDLLIFGNPLAGTPLMQVSQTIGIDLPLKALVWSDGAGRTWISYNNPQWLAQRHGAATGMGGPAAAMARALDEIAKIAAGSKESP